MSRWAHACSMASLPASLSTPRIRNGPIWYARQGRELQDDRFRGRRHAKLLGYLPYFNDPASRVASEIGFPFSEAADIVAAAMDLLDVRDRL